MKRILTEDQKKERDERHKEWRKNNPDYNRKWNKEFPEKIKKYRKNWLLKKAQKTIEHFKGKIEYISSYEIMEFFGIERKNATKIINLMRKNNMIKLIKEQEWIYPGSLPALYVFTE